MDANDLRLPDFDAFPHAVVLDLDGTLLAPDVTLRPRSRAAIEALLERDASVVVATARPVRTVRMLLGTGLLDQVGLVQMNGVAYRTPRGAHAALARFPADIATYLAALAAEHVPHGRVIAEIEGDDFGCDMPLTPEVLWQTNWATPEMVMPIATAAARGVAKIAINGIDQPVAALVSRLRRELGTQIEVIAEGSGTFANVVPRGVSKQAALARLLEHPDRAEPWAGMLAFGDDIADIEMLRLAEWGVAMANAHPEVHAVARYRTHSNGEDGVAHVIEGLLARFD
ncbi:MAG: HAD family phosphatase [Dehalococcoidia bacterium]|nr:MAG: HAD family phosphatase [Dehalococcoidia bacterium]